MYHIRILLLCALICCPSSAGADYPYDPAGSIVYFEIPYSAGSQTARLGIRKAARKESNTARYSMLPILTYNEAGQLFSLQNAQVAAKMFAVTSALDEMEKALGEANGKINRSDAARAEARMLARSDVSGTVVIDTIGTIGQSPIALCGTVGIAATIANIEGLIFDFALEAGSLTLAMNTADKAYQSAIFCRDMLEASLDDIKRFSKEGQCIKYEAIKNAYSILISMNKYFDLSYAFYRLISGSASRDLLDSAKDAVQADTPLLGPVLSVYGESKEATKLFWDYFFELVKYNKKYEKLLNDTVFDAYENSNIDPGYAFYQLGNTSTPPHHTTAAALSATENVNIGGKITFTINNQGLPKYAEAFKYGWEIVLPDGSKTQIFDTPSVQIDADKAGVYKCLAYINDGLCFKKFEKTVRVTAPAQQHNPLAIKSFSIIDHSTNSNRAIAVASINYDGADFSAGYAVFELGSKTYRRLIAKSRNGYSASCFLSRPSQASPVKVTVYDGNGNSISQSIQLLSAPAVAPSPAHGELIITSPSGGERWRKGTAHTISWASQETSHDKSYRIHLVSKSGERIKIGRRGFYKRSKYWAIPSTLPDGEYTIRMSDYEDNSIEYGKTTTPFSLVNDNDAPLAEGNSFQVVAGGFIELSIDAVDVNDDTLTYTVAETPSKGSVTITGNTLRYTPNTTALGMDHFTLEISDGEKSVTAKYGALIRDPSVKPKFQNIASTKPVSNDITGLFIYEDSVIVGNSQDSIIRFYSLNGTLQQSYDLDVGDTIDMDVYGSNLIVLTQREQAVLFDLASRTKRWAKNNVFGLHAERIAIGPDYAYAIGKDDSSDDTYQIKTITLQNGGVSVFPYDGDPCNDGRDMYAIEYFLKEKSRDDLFLFTGGKDEELQFWEQASSGSYSQGYDYTDRNMPDDVNSIFATSDAVFAGLSSGQVARVTYSGSTDFTVRPGTSDDVAAINVSGNEIFAGIGYSIFILSTTDGSILEKIENAHSSRITDLCYKDNMLITGDSAGNIKFWKRDWNTAPSPSVKDGTFKVGINQPGITEVLPGDPDPDDLHTYSISTPGTHGTATISAFGMLSYTPDKDYAGMDSVVVKVRDNHDGEANLSVPILVGNRAPEPSSLTLIADKNLLFTRQIDANDPDINAVHTFRIMTTPANGTATVTESGVLEYTPNKDFEGDDSLGIEVKDEFNATGTATYKLTVKNISPEAQPGTYILNDQQVSEFKLPIRDRNGDALTLDIVSAPSSGYVQVVDGNSGKMRYSPQLANIGGSSSEASRFIYTVSDSAETSPETAVALHVVAKISDQDSDGIADELDNAPTVFNPYQQAIAADSDNDGLSDEIEQLFCTNVYDADSDDDGILDGNEDINHNGIVDAGETNPCKADTDGDGLQDGTELGLTGPQSATDTNTDIFVPDADPATQTSAIKADSDGDGFTDGQEDANHNGKVDSGESDPVSQEDKPACNCMIPVYHLLLSQ